MTDYKPIINAINRVIIEIKKEYKVSKLIKMHKNLGEYSPYIMAINELNQAKYHYIIINKDKRYVTTKRMASK